MFIIRCLSQSVKYLPCHIHMVCSTSRRMYGQQHPLLVSRNVHYLWLKHEIWIFLDTCWSIRYTQSDKNPLVWNFLSLEPEVTCSTVAIIIRVPTLALLLCETLFTCSSSGASLCARSLTLLAYTTNACLSSPFHAYEKQQQPSSLLPFHLTHMYSHILQLAAPKNALHIFLSLCSKTVCNYCV
jgi:hypothetical protein